MSTLTPEVAPRLGPTPVVLPKVRAYMLGDFMRAFGIDEATIRTAQAGFLAGDIAGLTVSGWNDQGIVEETTIHFNDLVPATNSLTVNLGSEVSVTEQLSRRMAAAILYSVHTMQRRWLNIHYTFQLSGLGSMNAEATARRYGLKLGNAPKHAGPMREIYSLSHAPTGASLTHFSAR